MALESLFGRLGRGAAPEAVATARQMPMALRFSRFNSEEEFARAGQDLGARAAKARSPEELAAINAEANALQGAYTKWEASSTRSIDDISRSVDDWGNRSAQATTPEQRAALSAEGDALKAELERAARRAESRGPAFGQSQISPNERAVIQSKYGEERVLDPRTGYPQSAAGQPLRYEYTDPFMEAGKRMGQIEGRPAQSPSGLNYLFEKSRALGVDGKPIMKVGPTGQFEKFEGFTPGQRLAQVGAAAPVIGGLGASAMRDRETAPASTPAMGDEPGYFGAAGDEMTRTMVPEPGYSGAGGQMLQRALAQTAQMPSDAMRGFGFNQFRPDLQAAPRTAAAPANAPNPATISAPVPPRREQSQGVLSSLLGKVYDPDYQKGMSSREMFVQAQRDRDESPAAFFRAAARQREENPDFKPDMSRASGGSVDAKPGKDAALHKALEIIHMMLSRR